ncbi:hypothetical protein GGR57DRAFT_461826 [Xylariaceae sp. FL1272]|nr:hypothetical protein GGR57DRAFT_461826 [Xylariaceae sp. FL1272]
MDIVRYTSICFLAGLTRRVKSTGAPYAGCRSHRSKRTTTGEFPLPRDRRCVCRIRCGESSESSDAQNFAILATEKLRLKSTKMRTSGIALCLAIHCCTCSWPLVLEIRFAPLFGTMSCVQHLWITCDTISSSRTGVTARIHTTSFIYQIFVEWGIISMIAV